jgi:hypothetical protein
MPIDDLTALGDALRAAQKEKILMQEQLADESLLFDFKSISKGSAHLFGFSD